MVRNIGRIISSKQKDQDGENERSAKNSNAANGDSNTDYKSNIADVVKGFVQAQASITNNSANNEVIQLLQEVNNKLQQLPQFQESSSQQSEKNKKQVSNQKSQQQDNTDQQANNMVSQELQNLFSQILQPVNVQSQSNNQQDVSPKDSAEKNPVKAMAVQTASQVLAQAQYELANELEASLQKLKQVISDSEKIANQISNFLGESSNKKS